MNDTTINARPFRVDVMDDGHHFFLDFVRGEWTVSVQYPRVRGRDVSGTIGVLGPGEQFIDEEITITRAHELARWVSSVRRLIPAVRRRSKTRRRGW